MRLLIPVVNGIARANICPRFRDTYLVHVPVDDETHIFTRTQLVRVTGSAADRYREEMQKLRDEWAKKWKLEVHYTAEIIAISRQISATSTQAEPQWRPRPHLIVTNFVGH